MTREWKLVGGPTREWRGVKPDGTHIYVDTANYWLFLNGECYVGPFNSEKAVRLAAAKKLNRDRHIWGTMRRAAKIVAANCKPEIDLTTIEEKDLP